MDNNNSIIITVIIVVIIIMSKSVVNYIKCTKFTKIDNKGKPCIHPLCVGTMVYNR